MNILAARNQYRNGLMALVDGRYAEASDCFRAAIDLERDGNASGRCSARSLSYHGLCLALSDRPSPEAIQACEMAVRADRSDPDLRMNLGRVLALAGRRTRALAEYEYGLTLNPDHKTLRAERAKLDRRARPVLPFLARDHVLNHWLGRARAAMNRPIGSGRRAEI